MQREAKNKLDNNVTTNNSRSQLLMEDKAQDH